MPEAPGAHTTERERADNAGIAPTNVGSDA
jgi:hypothetical protein